MSIPPVSPPTRLNPTVVGRTRNLRDAAEKAGVQQVISQGLAYAYEPDGPGPAPEDAPLWKQPPRPFVPVLAALRELERRTVDAGGLVVRFGHLYGPGTIYAQDGSFVRQVRAGKVPLVGGGTATFSFTMSRMALLPWWPRWLAAGSARRTAGRSTWSMTILPR